MCYILKTELNLLKNYFKEFELYTFNHHILKLFLQVAQSDFGLSFFKYNKNLIRLKSIKEINK